MVSMVPRVYGSQGGCLKMGRARLYAALKSTSASFQLTFHVRLCIICQTYTMLTQLTMVEAMYNLVSWAMNAEMRLVEVGTQSSSKMPLALQQVWKTSNPNLYIFLGRVHPSVGQNDEQPLGVLWIQRMGGRVQAWDRCQVVSLSLVWQCGWRLCVCVGIKYNNKGSMMQGSGFVWLWARGGWWSARWATGGVEGSGQEQMEVWEIRRWGRVNEEGGKVRWNVDRREE